MPKTLQQLVATACTSECSSQSRCSVAEITNETADLSCFHYFLALVRVSRTLGQQRRHTAARKHACRATTATQAAAVAERWMRRLIYLTFRCLGLFAPLLALTLIFCNALHATAASLAGSDPGDWIRFYYTLNSNAVHHFDTFCRKAQRLSTTHKLTSKTILVRGLLPQCTRVMRGRRGGGFKLCKHATTPRLDILRVCLQSAREGKGRQCKRPPIPTPLTTPPSCSFPP
jgi:hypothetical protein